MSDPSTPIQTVSALPDIASTPNDPKKPKLSHTGTVHQSELELQPGSESEQDVSEINGNTSPIIQAIPLPLDELEVEEEWWDLKMSWSGKVYDLKVGGNDMSAGFQLRRPKLIDEIRVYDFRAIIQILTSVPPIRQKLIGLSKGKLSSELDSARFGSLGVKKECRFTMIGTPEDMSFKDPSDIVLPDVSGR
jgi:ubiquitin-like domain-containing CTD phosphatase 1